MSNHYLESTIKRNYRFFSDTEKKVADYLLKNPDDLVNKTIANLSDETSVSQATIFKLVKKLGFKGFQDFKINVASNSSNDSDPALIAYNDIKPEDSSYEIAVKVINSNILALQHLPAQLDQAKLDNSLERIYQSKFLHFFGIGGSSVIAYDAYQKFTRTNYRCDYISDYHLQLMAATKLTKEDTAFVFSHSGQSLETLKLAKIIAKTGATLIFLTGNPYSEIASLADETLTVYSEESKYRTESLTARILYLTLMDTLYINLMLHDERKGQEAIKKIRNALSESKTRKTYSKDSF